MISCTLTAFGKPMTCHLPVMDNKNKAITNPDAFAVNTAMQRCLVKAIALHGLGLYIYAGEDLPFDGDAEPAPRTDAKPEVKGGSAPAEKGAILPERAAILPANFDKMVADLRNAKTLNDLNGFWKKINDWIGDNANPTQDQTAELSDMYRKRLATFQQAAATSQQAPASYNIEEDEIPF